MEVIELILSYLVGYSLLFILLGFFISFILLMKTIIFGK